MGAAWTPQIGPQADAISATWCTELLYGGAKFGGKSDFLLGDFLQDVPKYGKHWQGILFRQAMPEFEELIRRSHEIYPQTGAVWQEQKKRWVWPSHGSCLRLRFLERVQDFWAYNGSSFTWIGFDELGQWTDLTGYNFVCSGCLRWAEADVPTKRIRCSANPGGPGHSLVKERFIDPAPLGYHPIDDLETDTTRMYIPARVSDNKLGLLRDPNYVKRLRGVGNPEMVRAWLEGDWTVVTGAYFPEFGQDHIIKPFDIPKHWNRFGAFDWGSAHPYCFLWFAVSDGSVSPYPKDALICYREDYGAKSANVGLKLTAEEVADRILSKWGSDDLAYVVADPECWHKKGGPTLAERMQSRGINAMRPWDNRRIPGWDMVRQRLKGFDNTPMIYFFEVCRNTIRTVPLLQHDDIDAEDAGTTGEDHCCDTVRGACMSRPWAAPAPEVLKHVVRRPITIDQLLQDHIGRRGSDL